MSYWSKFHIPNLNKGYQCPNDPQASYLDMQEKCFEIDGENP